MLGHLAARPRDDEGRGGGDIEGVCAVAARAGGVQQQVPFRWMRHVAGLGAHGARAAGDLVDRLALHAQGDQIAADLGLGGLPGHDDLHGRFGLRFGQMCGPGSVW